MSGNIYFSTPASAPTPPTPINTDIYLESVLQGQISNLAPIYVELQDGGGAPITPTSSSLVGNTLTAVLPTPAPSGVALKVPNGQIRTSYYNYDSGWRMQNGIYNYSPPSYPAKYAELDYTAGANWWYTLKTPLRVGGVLSTQRFVDLSGVQGWGGLNNLGYAVLDKLTGILFSRSPITGVTAGNLQTSLNNLYALSVVINGNTYSNWYQMGVAEAISIFGNVATTTNWVDPSSGLTILPGGIPSRCILSQPYQGSGFLFNFLQATATLCDIASDNINSTTNSILYFTNARNLISA